MLTHEEWRKLTDFIEGAKIRSAWPSPPDRRDFRFAAFRAGRPLPPGFRRDDEMPPVGDQGRFGTCVAWGCSYGQKGCQERRLVAERLGCAVNWQASTGVVEIVNPAKGGTA